MRVDSVQATKTVCWILKSITRAGYSLAKANGDSYDWINLGEYQQVRQALQVVRTEVLFVRWPMEAWHLK